MLTVDGVIVRFVLERADRSVVPSLEIADRVQMPDPGNRSFSDWDRLCYLTRGIDRRVIEAWTMRLQRWSGHALTQTNERLVPSSRAWVDPDLLAAQIASASVEAVPLTWADIAHELGIGRRKLDRLLLEARALVRQRIAGCDTL